VDTQELLESAFVEVLEKFAFMFGEPVSPSDLTPPNDPFWQASIGFSGPQKGLLQVAAASSFCVQLAANVLGIDLKCMTPEAGADAFKELLNVVCGELLEKMAGTDVVFNLTIPQVETKPPEEWGPLTLDSQMRGLLVDEMPVLIKLEMTS